MYWKEIPVQVQAEGDSRQVSRPLDGRFQEGVDAIASFDGSSGSDEYLMAWEWGEHTERQGSAEKVVTAVAEGFNSGFPRDFVARIRDLHQSGSRDPSPGAIDHWVGDDTP